MDSLSDSSWDVVISGTGLAQSLLALALSRSGKKVLHVDKNDYYGGPDAAFSLQEAEDWAKRVNEDTSFGPFESASILRSLEPSEAQGKLSFSRAYTLPLSPHLIYSKSKLLPNLVSSKIYRQLEFLAVGSWWVWRTSDQDGSASEGAGILQRIPSSREDVFADETMSMKSKRSLMKFLRHLQPAEGQASAVEEEDLSFPDFLQSKLQISPELHDPLMALSLTPNSLDETSTSYALPRIKRHLESLGVFGPGFASMVMKWGGAAELSQVACRACAVGGGVYVLNRGIQSIVTAEAGNSLRVELSNGEWVQSKFVAGSPWDLPTEALKQEEPASYTKVARSIMIVSSPLETLFPVTSEGGPVSAGTVVAFPGRSVGQGNSTGSPPVYLLIHSSDTGECPQSQCVIYGSTLLPSEEGYAAIVSATKQLLSSVDPRAEILLSLQYTQLGRLGSDASPLLSSSLSDQVFSFSAPCLDLAFDDGVVDQVRQVWKIIMGDEVDESQFLVFEDRDGTAEDE
ncbi:hypothetical protein VTO42DRAFT_8401 [Malbranchea cinnamomea]